MGSEIYGNIEQEVQEKTHKLGLQQKQTPEEVGRTGAAGKTDGNKQWKKQNEEVRDGSMMRMGGKG